MLKTVVILGVLLNISCSAQSPPFDTLFSSKIITRIDNFDNACLNCTHIIVWRQGHNETEYYYDVLVDTLSKQIFRCDYVTKTINPKDTTIERKSYYLDKNLFLALVYKELRNNYLVSYHIFYLDSEPYRLKAVYPNSLPKGFAFEDINSDLKDLQLLIINIKKHLQEKNGS